MSKITILCIGDLKERFLKDGCAEYMKRLSGYCDISVVELKEESIPEKASKKEEEAIKEKEGERICNALKPSDFLVALDLNQEEPDSLELAKSLQNYLQKSGSRLYFAIGGSLGIGENVRKRANALLSLSRLTFTHKMTRLILLEALYRSFRIARGEPYHK